VCWQELELNRRTVLLGAGQKMTYAVVKSSYRLSALGPQ